jgi:hypothetical protein
LQAGLEQLNNLIKFVILVNDFSDLLGKRALLKEELKEPSEMNKTASDRKN